MNYKVAFYSDVGIKKDTNQDSCCFHIAETDHGKILFAVLCDGMGGLAKGEVASATLITVFSDWFTREFPLLLSENDIIHEVQYAWDRMIKIQNQNIAEYGRMLHLQLGSTLTALLILEDGSYIIGHVGDSRAYRVTENRLDILTNDQTVVAREIRQGRLTPEQAENDPRRNVLLQCVGASRVVQPEFYYGTVTPGERYFLCSDGFRHTLTAAEIHAAFAPDRSQDENAMKAKVTELIERNKNRGETDNITALLIATE